MRPIKPMKSSQKKRKINQFRTGMAVDWKNNQPQFNNYQQNRSSSGGRKQKLRLLNEYEDAQQKGSSEKQVKRNHNAKRKKQIEYTSNKRTTPDGSANTPSKKNNKVTQIRQMIKKSSQGSQPKSKEKKVTSGRKHADNKNKKKKKRQEQFFSHIQFFEDLCSKIKKETSKAKKQSMITSRQRDGLKLTLSKILDNPEKQEHNRPTFKRPYQHSQDALSQNHTYQEGAIEFSSSSSDNENEDEQFSGLTEDEEQIFGDRFPYGFKKIKLLGKGGFSLVWLGKHVKSEKQFAIKQIITQNAHQTHLKQIWFGTTFFTLGGLPKQEFSRSQGVQNLVKLYSYQINPNDTWLFYQKCGSSLGASLYDIRPQRNYFQSKLYRSFYKPFYWHLIENPKNLIKIIIQVCKPLNLLCNCNIVHSDLKTQNILIKMKENSAKQFCGVKLIDYGSSFEFDDISQFSMATPEYMPPEILNYIIHQNQGQYEEQLYHEVMNNYFNPWVIDIFSLGCVFLEIIVGVPLWMSLPILIPNHRTKSSVRKEGLFAVKGRIFRQIIHKQRKIITNLDETLERQNYTGIKISAGMKKVLKGMLNLDYTKRISPAEAIRILQNDLNS